MKINLTNIKPQKMNQKVFTITLLLESKLSNCGWYECGEKYANIL